MLSPFPLRERERQRERKRERESEREREREREKERERERERFQAMNPIQYFLISTFYIILGFLKSSPLTTVLNTASQVLKILRTSSDRCNKPHWSFANAWQHVLHNKFLDTDICKD